MKRFLSWVILILSCILVYFIQTIACNIASFVIGLFLSFSTFMKIMLSIVAFGIICGLIFAPIVYGSALAVFASESVSPSKKKLRYSIWGTIHLIWSALIFVQSYMNGEIVVVAILAALFAIALIITGNHQNK